MIYKFIEEEKLPHVLFLHPIQRNKIKDKRYSESSYPGLYKKALINEVQEFLKQKRIKIGRYSISFQNKDDAIEFKLLFG